VIEEGFLDLLHNSENAFAANKLYLHQTYFEYGGWRKKPPNKTITYEEVQFHLQ
jgi:hypothetical protein